VTPAEPDSDEALAARAGAGDRGAFEAVMRRHKAGIHRFIRRYVGQDDEAYDILQETFLSAWMAGNRYDPARPFLPWIRTIALNKCRDFARRRTVRRLLLREKAAEPDEMAMPAPDEGTPEALEADRLKRLDRAIAELPVFYKEPLLLTSVSGLSHQEAAELLKTTAKAIEMRIYRAKRKLAETLEDSGEG
jgi:RNA polymerase sigma-70 factor (ECF subfamily)